MRWRLCDDATVRCNDGDVRCDDKAMLYRVIAPSLSRHRTIAILTFCTCAVSKKMASDLIFFRNTNIKKKNIGFGNV